MSETKITLDINPNRSLVRLVHELAGEWGRARDIRETDVRAMLIGAARLMGDRQPPLSEARESAAWDYAETAAVDFVDAHARELGKALSRDSVVEQAKATSKGIERAAFEEMKRRVEEIECYAASHEHKPTPHHGITIAIEAIGGRLDELKNRVAELEKTGRFVNADGRK